MAAGGSAGGRKAAGGGGPTLAEVKIRSATIEYMLKDRSLSDQMERAQQDRVLAKGTRSRRGFDEDIANIVSQRDALSKAFGETVGKLRGVA